MKRYWLAIVAAFALIGAAAGERFSAGYAENLAARQAALKEQAAGIEQRAKAASNERAEYESTQALARKIGAAIRWESESTQRLRWFEEIAAQAGVRLANSRMLTDEKSAAAPAVGDLQHARYEIAVHGRFKPLVQFLACIESAPQPTLVETLSLLAVRDSPDEGDLKLAVSCIWPAQNKLEPQKGVKDR